MKAKLRKKYLIRNQKLLFWAQALINVKLLNSVAVLFYIHRGLTLREIFFLSIVWSVVILLTEIPSSYLADRWGRKKTLIVGYVSLLIQNIILFNAHSLFAFIVSFVFLAGSFALLSGTDEAMVYDTDKELKNTASSLKTLSRYYASQRIFKMFTPIIGVLIARDLMEFQFQIIVVADFLSILIGFILILLTIEPRRSMSVIKEEAGIITGAFHIVIKNKMMRIVMINKIVMFIATFIVWRYHQDLFVNMGVPVIILGIMWSCLQGGLFVSKMIISKKKRGINQLKSLIFRLNILSILNLFLLLVGVILNLPYLFLLFFFVFAMGAESLRWPLFSEIFNKQFKSYNRATSLSMTNVLKSIIDIPLFLIVMAYIDQSALYPIIISLSVMICVVLFFSIKKVRLSHT